MYDDEHDGVTTYLCFYPFCWFWGGHYIALLAGFSFHCCEEARLGFHYIYVYVVRMGIYSFMADATC